MELRDRLKDAGIDIGPNMLRELVILAGGDDSLVLRCAMASKGVNECKARIIDGRFQTVERTNHGSEDRNQQ
jgi:hypothetical protein